MLYASLKLQYCCLASVIVSFLFAIPVYSQVQSVPDSMALIFAGDIMGHEAQIHAAFNSSDSNYYYNDVFKKVAPIIQSADFAVANLEVTLAGQPYKGYPNFSSPDELASACKNCGIDVLLTSNNHACDRGKKGVLRTIHVLDSLELLHTGTFIDSTSREHNNLLILEKGSIKVGLLNYTYGTNGLTVPAPILVNLLDTLSILRDIKNSYSRGLDMLMVCLHWGNEYQKYPSAKQKEMVHFLLRNNVNIVVGSHPHVIQGIEFMEATEAGKEKLIAYSLGNFVSDQRTRGRDGGLMLQILITKNEHKVEINDFGYYLTWVHKYRYDGKNVYEILPNTDKALKDIQSPFLKDKMVLFVSDTRQLMRQYGQANNEIIYTSKKDSYEK